MKELEVIQVVRTTLVRRGRGTPADPNRAVEQYYALDGTMLFERDPCEPPLSARDAVHRYLDGWLMPAHALQVMRASDGRPRDLTTDEIVDGRCPLCERSLGEHRPSLSYGLALDEGRRDGRWQARLLCPFSKPDAA